MQEIIILDTYLNFQNFLYADRELSACVVQLTHKNYYTLILETLPVKSTRCKHSTRRKTENYHHLPSSPLTPPNTTKIPPNQLLNPAERPFKRNSKLINIPVSYTHLTLPTKRIV